MIYFDNAATTMVKPKRVGEAISRALTSFGGVGRGVHPASVAAGLAVYEARSSVSDLLGAPGGDRVAFAANATAALNIAIAGLLPDGGKALSTAASHNSVLRPLFAARDKRGCTVAITPVSDSGVMDYRAFEAGLDGVDVAVVTHASNLTGDIYDAHRIADAAHARGVPVILDAAQTAGAIPLDMESLGVDVLCFTGHKSLLGPQGTGGLCVSRGVEIPPFLEGGSGTHSFEERHPSLMPESLEAGTLNAHGLAGLAEGIAYLKERTVEEISVHEALLRRRLCQGLQIIEGARILGSGSEGGCCGIVAFNIADMDSAFVADRLANGWGICTRAGAHCAPLMHKALHTERQGAVRISFGPFNTIDEVDLCLDALQTIAYDGR